MSSKKFVITFFTVMVILSLTGLSSVTAETIAGEALGDSHEYIETGPDYAIIEKGVYHELYDNAKITDSAFGTVCASSEDGNVTLNLDSDIAVWGTVKGDAYAELYGYVYAEGKRNETTGEFNVNTEISSSVYLEPGTKGKAEGNVAASGEATAMNANETLGGPELFSTVSGSTMAMGKTESSAPCKIDAEGILYSFVNANLLDGPSYELESEIESEVEGTGTSTGFASAMGSADAHILDEVGGFFTGVEGNTSAAASGKGNGYIFAEAEMESEVEFITGDPNEYYAGTSIYTDAYVDGYTKSFKGSASALAETPAVMPAVISPFDTQNAVPIILCPTNYAIETTLMGNNFHPVQNGAIIGAVLSSVEADGTSASTVNVKGPGWSDAYSEIFAEYYYPNTETYEGEIDLDGYLGVDYQLSSEYFDESMLYGGVEVGGYDQYFSGKASTMAEGLASATAADDVIEPSWTSNTFAFGDLFGDASVTGTGYAEGYTDIESVNLVDVTGGYIGISSENGIPLYDANISLPDIDGMTGGLPEFPDEMTLPSGMVMPTQLDGFMTEVPIPDIPSFEFGTGIPERTLTEFSQITSESSAFGNAKKDTAMVTTTAEGFTNAYGYVTVPPVVTDDPTLTVIADTGASGVASTMANAQMKTDPASTAVIMAVSSPYASEDVQFANLLDASFIGTVSFADGIRGYTTGTAEGLASANSNVNYLEVLGPAIATGSVDSKAYANGGTGISAGIIGAGSYLDFYQEDVVDTSSVSAALLGSVSSALGNARSESAVSGIADAFSAYTATDGEDTLVSTYNSAFGTGNASTFAKTNNGIALAADGIIAGQYVSAFTDVDTIGEGEIIGGSIIADAVFAQGPGIKGSAEAGAAADGYGSTKGDLYAITNGVEDPVQVFVMNEAFGEVGGSAIAKRGDPLSASVIMSFADANGGNTSGFPEGNTYAAGLMMSASVANGQYAQTEGYADGGTMGFSTLFYNGTPVGGYSYNASSFAGMEGITGSSAISTSVDTIALGLGINGVSSSSEFYENADGQMVVGESDGAPWPSFFDLSVKGALAAVLGDGTANAGAAVEYADAVSTADVSSPISGTLESVYGETTATGDAFANVKSKGGIGIGGAIEGSGVFIEAIPNLGGAPSTDITDFSGMAAIAFAEGDGPKDTVSADSAVFGVTDAFGNMSHPKAYVEQYTNATGGVTASVLSNKYTDPLAGSIILSYGNSELDGVDFIADNYDATLIATAVLADGYKAQGTATAAGSTEADGLILDDTNGMYIDAWGSTEGTFISDVSVAKGGAIALSGAGSSSSARFDNITGESRVRDMNVMGSLTEGSGDYAGAFAGYDATSEAESQVAPIIGEVGMVYAFSESGVNGVGGSDIQAKKSQAESISFGMAYQEAVEGEDIGNTVFSAAAFGTFAAATDGAKNTMAGASMSDVDMYAYAENMTRYSDVDYGGGVSYITLDPDGKPRITWDTYATWVYTDGVYELAADEKAYDTTSEPNYGIWYKYVMASDVPLPDPPKPDDILPFLGVIPP
jgi:hypothetical protein